MKASSYRLTTTVHAYEGKTMSTSRREHSETPTKGMGTNPATVKSKCHGYICRKNMRKDRRKRRNKSSNDATRRICSMRRIPPKRTRRWKTKRSTQS